MNSDPLDELRWKLLALLHAFIGLTALVGGMLLVVWPSGRMMGISVDQLAASPFRDFLLPGLVRYGAVGVHHAMAAFLVFNRESGAQFASLSSGVALVIWILVQRSMVRDFHWLQYGYLALGAIIVLQAVILQLHGASQRPAHA